MHLLDYFNSEGPPTALFEIGPDRCPTCGESGPDVYEPSEYGGVGDLRCGDEWHADVVDVADVDASEGTHER